MKCLPSPTVFWIALMCPLALLAQAPSAASDNTPRSAEPAELQFFIASDIKDRQGIEATLGEKTIYLIEMINLRDGIVRVRSVLDSNGLPAIEVNLTEPGAKNLAVMTANNIGKRLAVFVGDKLVTAPTIQSQINGRAIISGDFTTEEVQGLVQQITPPPFQTRMVLIKDDWTEGLTDVEAKELAAEVRSSLEGVAVPQELLDQLPDTALEILFPMQTVSLFTREHYEGLAAWLELKKLVVSEAPFPGAEVVPVLTAVGVAAPEFPSFATSLTKPASFFTPDDKLKDLFGYGAPRLFVTQSPSFMWHISQAFDGREVGLTFQRQTVMRLQKRGQAKVDVRELNETHVQCVIPGGHVAIMNAFVDRNEQKYIGACQEKGGFIPLIVTLPTSRADGDAKRAVVAAVRPPDVIETIDPTYTNTQLHQPNSGGFPYYSTVPPVDDSAKKKAGLDSRYYGAQSSEAGTEGVPALRISGAVHNTGEFAGTEGMRVLDALVLAGGLTENASSEVLITRQTAKGRSIAIRVDLNEAKIAGQYNLPVFAGDVITVLAKPAAERIEVFQLRRVEAEAVQSTLRQFYGGDASGYLIEADARKNRILVRGPEEVLAEVGKLIEQLDTPRESPSAAGREDSSRGSEKDRAAQLRREFANAFGFGAAAPGAPSTEGQEPPLDEVFMQFETAKADSIEKVLREVYRDLNLAFTLDEQKNSLSVRGDKAVLEEVLGLAAKLDEAFAPDSSVRIEKLMPGTIVHTHGTLEQSQAIARFLHELYEASERVARETAAKLSDLQANNDRSDTTSVLATMLQDQLRSQVAKSFELRQAHHQMELSVMEHKIRRTRKSIAQRKRIRDQIIDRRVDDLLNPDSRWPGQEPGAE